MYMSVAKSLLICSEYSEIDHSDHKGYVYFLCQIYEVQHSCIEIISHIGDEQVDIQDCEEITGLLSRRTVTKDPTWQPYSSTGSCSAAFCSTISIVSISLYDQL